MCTLNPSSRLKIHDHSATRTDLHLSCTDGMTYTWSLTHAIGRFVYSDDTGQDKLFTVCSLSIYRRMKRVGMQLWNGELQTPRSNRTGKWQRWDQLKSIFRNWGEDKKGYRIDKGWTLPNHTVLKQTVCFNIKHNEESLAIFSVHPWLWSMETTPRATLQKVPHSRKLSLGGNTSLGLIFTRLGLLSWAAFYLRKGSLL